MRRRGFSDQQIALALDQDWGVGSVQTAVVWNALGQLNHKPL